MKQYKVETTEPIVQKIVVRDKELNSWRRRRNNRIMKEKLTKCYQEDKDKKLNSTNLTPFVSFVREY